MGASSWKVYSGAFALAAVALAVTCSSRDQESPPAPERFRLVSIGPELSRLLVDLGVGSQVAATDSHSLAIPELSHALDLGDPGSPSIEVARSARADRVLVLAGGSDPAAALARALETEGIPTTVLTPLDADQVIAAIRQVGRVVDREIRATAVAASRTRAVAEVAIRRDGRTRLRVAWVLEGDPITVVGGAGMLHQLLELAGGENAFHGTADSRRSVSRDVLAASGADLVIGTPPLPDVPGALPVGLDPALSALPLLDLPERVRLLHDALYPASPATDAR
jgi:ABC-type Fe3+-hydroxamate transport system substrate-binding protein